MDDTLEENNEEEMEEIDVTEVALDEGEITELIEKLQTLKKTKTEFTFDIDEDNEFLIKYQEEDLEEEEDEDSGD